MGALIFVCPVTGQEVCTELEVDAKSFDRLLNSEQVWCPACKQPHALSVAKARLTEGQRAKSEPSS